MLRTARRRAFPRTALATAVVLAATSGLTGTMTLPAAAEDPAPAPAADEVVIPDPGRFRPRAVDIDHAGAGGYVHSQEGRTLLWRDLATGTDSPLPSKYLAADTARHSGHFAFFDRDTRRMTVTDLSTGATTTLDVPPAQGQVWLRGFTRDSMLTATRTADGRYGGLRLWRSTGGEVTEQPVTGLRDTVASVRVLEQDMRGALVTTQAVAEGPYTTYLLDYATAELTPTTTVPLLADRSLGHDRLLVEQSNDAVLTVPRDNPSATPVVTPLPAKGMNEAAWSKSTVLGDWILVRHDLDPFWGTYSEGGKLYAVPLGGGTARELLPHGAGDLTVMPDGSVLVVGGTRAQDWAVHHVTLGEDGVPRLAPVAKVPQMPASYRGIAVGGGRVSYLSNTMPGQTLYEVDTRTPTEVRRRDWYATDNMPAPKGPFSLGDGQSAVAWSSAVEAPIIENSSRVVYLPAEATLLDAGGRYTLSTDGTSQYVTDFGDTQGAQILLKRPQGAAALWGTKLWKPAATGTGKVNSYDLVTQVTAPVIDLGSGCVPAELQALGRWLYWACAGGAKAGVYDQQLKKSVAVPAGEALLGDGYVVRRDNAAGKLLLTEAATGRTSEFADIPVRTATGSGRRVDWSVDKFGGGVAFVDAQKNIHVKRVPIAPQPLAVLHAFEMGKYPSDPVWTHLWRLSRPAGAWKVTIRTAGGSVVRTLSGEGGEGASVRAVWDGKDEAGNGVLEGTYRYDLEAREPGGTTTALRAGGTIQAYGTVLTTSPSSYQPLAPKRVLDTRAGVGIRKAKLAPWQRFQLKVAGVGGVPATGATSVVLNVTATNTTKPGHISVLPGTAGPYHSSNGSSQVNFTAGQTTSNLVVVPVVDGKVEFFANTSGSTDLVADVSGYHTTATGSAFQPLAPTRFMDTRSGTGVPRAKIGQGGTARLQVAGVKGVPASGVTAVVMNVTATNATKGTYVTAYPDGTPRPGTSSLNVPAGRTVAGAVVVPVVNGKVAFTNGWGSVDLLGDVVGYYTNGSGSAFTGTEPRRLMDTRLGFGVRKGAVGPGQSVTLQAGGAGVIPEKVKAVVLNVTATQPTTAGYVTVHPAGTPRGTTSSLNFRAGQTVPNLVVVPVVDGKVTFSNHSGNVHLIADVEGWFL
ncbi:FlgD immunoglobulin-like domain containing protein [Streptomyces sp. NPDC006339]|uniref:FlgD immunoglobulin-like domain containing protein n=1 Tax=Streptomyces sp. NPDC006339 TaxID=3156755 RepID=UPI0033B990C7